MGKQHSCDNSTSFTWPTNTPCCSIYFSLWPASFWRHSLQVLFTLYFIPSQVSGLLKFHLHFCDRSHINIHINIFTSVILSWCLTPDLWWKSEMNHREDGDVAQKDGLLPPPEPNSPTVLRVFRQLWAPFNSSLQLNNPLWLLKISMFILIAVWLRTLPNPQLVLPPCSLTYIPPSLGLNFVQPRIRNTNLRGKKVLVTNTLDYLWSKEQTQHCFPQLLSPCVPHAGQWLGCGWVWCWIWEQLELPACPANASLNHTCSLGTVGLLMLQKKSWEAGGNAFSANSYGDGAWRWQR